MHGWHCHSPAAHVLIPLKLISAVQVIREQTVLQIRVSSGIFLPAPLALLTFCNIYYNFVVNVVVTREIVLV